MCAEMISGITFLAPRTILWLYAAAASANAIAKLLPSEDLDRFTKPLLMPLLLFYVYQKSIGNTTLKILLLSGAILFSWFGDVALMYRYNHTYFILGISLCLIARIFYIITLRKASYQIPDFTIQRLFPFILYAGGFFYLLLPAGVFTVPIIVYEVLILGVAFTAYSRKEFTSVESYKTVLLGSIFFVLSDLILVINTFRQSITYGGFFVMLTYCAAQFFLVSGILKHVD